MAKYNKGPLNNTFDYAIVKRAFFQEVDYVLLKYKLKNKVVIYKNTLKSIILEFVNKRSSCKTFFGAEYKIARENDRMILCKIVCSEKEPHEITSFKRILSIEDIFNVIIEIHLHEPQLRFEEFLDKLSNCIILPCFIEMHDHETLQIFQEALDDLSINSFMPSLLKLLWKVCNCNCCHNIIERPNGFQLDMWFNIVGEMDVIAANYSKLEFRVLVYVETNTNFVLLRPLKSYQAEEIANELLSIFCDFGPAHHLGCYRKAFFLDALKILESLPLPFSVPQIYSIRDYHKINVVDVKVRHMIQKWMDRCKSKNWEIGTHIVQWIMNTSEVKNTYIRSRVLRGPSESPYHALFGNLPHTDQIHFNFNKSVPEVIENFPLCSQCRHKVHKVYKCHSCQAICHFKCCERIVVERNAIVNIINRCNSCRNNNIEEFVLGV